LRAPFDGLVMERPVTAGETAVTRTRRVPLVTRARDDRRQAAARVSGEQPTRRMPGAEGSVRVGSRRYRAVVKALRPEANPEGILRHRAVAVFAVNDSGAGSPGQRAVLDLPR
jgi:hypothetical protein